MNTRIIELEKKINVKFKDKKILIKSLTHKSFDKNYNNEKLEFLGDRVLGLIISKNLLQFYPLPLDIVLSNVLYFHLKSPNILYH